MYLTSTNNTACLLTKQRTEKALCKQETSINNLESKEEANNEEFIHFSGGKKRCWKEEGKRLSEMHKRHHGTGQGSSTEHPRLLTQLSPQALQPRRKPWRISPDTEFWFKFPF